MQDQIVKDDTVQTMALKMFSYGMIGAFVAGLGLTIWSSGSLLVGL